jgi:hypothetical protein
VLGVCLAALLATQVTVRADEQELMEHIKQLEKRIAKLENRSAQEVSLPSAELPQKTLDFLGQTEISGFASTSFFAGPPAVDPGNTELTSLTGTVNFTPITNLQIRPEIRYDHASEYIFADGAGAKKDQFTIGVGVAYLY